jgi:DNA-binding transcriptional LysR family regulator
MRVQLQSLDLHHLTVLHLLLQECSVTRAAARAGQPQPTVSRILRRLREVLDDQILVRSGAQMVPTERALAMRQPMTEIMAQIARLEVESRFNPVTSDREFVIAAGDCIATMLLPQVIAKVIASGPRLRVSLRMISPGFDVARALEEGEIDLVIDNSPNPRPQLWIGYLYDDDVVCLVRSDHAMAKRPRLSLARYLALRHLAPHPRSATELGPIDGELAKAGYRRLIAATVPEFNMAPYVLTYTDLVFTTGRLFAEHYATRLPLKIVLAPGELPPMKFYQLWHERNHASAANRWLRRLVADVAKTLVRSSAESR